MTTMHFPANFKSKMADERGLYNFIESPLTLLIGTQTDFNAQYVSIEYFEQAILHSVWQSEDSVL